MIGVLGGGQLGAMFGNAARRLGYRVAVWDPDPDAPALRAADFSLSAPFHDSSALAEFAEAVSAATYEWENIPVTVAAALEQAVPLTPSSRILGLLQNRIEQKSFLRRHGFAVAPFRIISSPGDVIAAAESIGFPCLCKTATSGYDGKGQWRLLGSADVRDLQQRFYQAAQEQTQQWIVEQFLQFEKELSALIVRSADGTARAYPVVENVHEGGILRVSQVPADVPPPIAERAGQIAASVVEALDGVGVFCVELFLMPDGRLLINEVAPRPHNSGHYTLDACTVSQFEQQVRALCNLPLGEVRLLSPAVMVNLIGHDLTRTTTSKGLVALLSEPGAALHVYGKRTVRPGRKMGHVTFLRDTADQAWEAAMMFRRLLGGTEPTREMSVSSMRRDG